MGRAEEEDRPVVFFETIIAALGHLHVETGRFDVPMGIEDPTACRGVRSVVPPAAGIPQPGLQVNGSTSYVEGFQITPRE